MRKFALLVSVVVFSGWSSGALAVPIEWTVASGGNGHFYEIVPAGQGWSDAQASAVSAGGYLVTITSSAEQGFIEDFIVPTGSADAFKIGGFQDTSALDYSEPGGGWRWVTGEPWTYTNWSPGEPNNCCPVGENYLTLHRVPANGFEYTWNDNVSFSHLGAIVEYGAPIPEPSTALLLGIGMMGLGMRRRRRTRSGCCI